MASSSVHITKSGPWFDRREEIIRSYIDDAEQTLADYAEREVHAQLQEVLKHPTGYYEGHVQVTSAPDGLEVTDGGVVYGPWLEGTGSRNETTRFKGYSTFRKVADKVDREAERIAEEVLARHIGRFE